MSKLTQYSRVRIMESAAQWSVPQDFFDPLFNYLVHGFEPGSFWTAVLANDFFRAVQSSHPSNSIPHLKYTTGWIRDRFPVLSYGNYSVVKGWLELGATDRRLHLEDQRLIYTEQEEVELALRGVETTPEPLLFG